MNSEASWAQQDSKRYSEMLLDVIEAEADRLGTQALSKLTPSIWPAERMKVREELITSLGLDPMPHRSPLNAQLVGVHSGPGYRVEKYILELRDGFLASGLLYVPEGVALPAPAVLYAVGHWMRNGKAEPDVQAACIGLASQGFVVFVFDPIGQGERGASFDDHGHLELFLLGLSQEGLMVWENVRAIDFLLSRPEVDGNRIGMTGASGGGLSTVYTAAYDPRIAVAVPVCYVTSYSRFLRAMRGLNWNNLGDLCNQVPDVIRYAEMAGLCALIHPRPLLVINGARDPQFPAEGAEAVVADLHELYAPMGPDRLALHVVDAGHGYDRQMRQAAYGWFLRWLQGKGDGSPIIEPSLRLRSPTSDDLKCFLDQESLSPEQGFVALKEQALATALAEQNSREHPADTANVKHVLGLGIAPEVPLHTTCLNQSTTDGYQNEEIAFHREHGLVITGSLTTPARFEEPKWISLTDADDAQEHDAALSFAASNRVMKLYVRGTGRTTPKPPETMTRATYDGQLEEFHPEPNEHLEFETTTDSVMLGRSLLGQQVSDILAASEYLCSASSETILGIHARGPLSSLQALFAAVLDVRLQKVVLEGLPVSFADIALERTFRFPPSLYLFRAVHYFDIGHLLVALSSRNVVIANPRDATNRPMSAADFMSRHSDTLVAFRLQGTTLRVVDGDVSGV